jgi:hypothetical protein
MPGYLFKIEEVPFYASEEPTWLSKGPPNILASGAPSPYQPGSFSINLNAVNVHTPTAYGGDFATSGTLTQLFSIFDSAWSTTDGVVHVDVFDPRTNSHSTISARMKPPLQLPRGAAAGNVLVEFYSAFISDEARATYYGGDPNPVTDLPPYIPGDPLPPGDTDEVGWNVGEWNSAVWNQEAA